MPTDFPPPSTWSALLVLIPMAAFLILTGILQALPGPGSEDDRERDDQAPDRDGSKPGAGGPSRSALLLDTVDFVTADLACNLLETAGIPIYRHSPDFDVAELGVAAHDSIRGKSVFVPASALERAREILAEAWGEEWDAKPDSDTAAED